MSDHRFQLEHDEDRPRVVVTLAARVTVDVWSASLAALVDAGAWGVPLVYDMRAVQPAPLLANLPNLMSILGTIIERHGPPGAVGVVVAAEDVPMWRQRLAGSFRDRLVIEAFATADAAHAWLDAVRAA